MSFWNTLQMDYAAYKVIAWENYQLARGYYYDYTSGE